MAISHVMPLPRDLADVQIQMESHARDYGLDFFPTIFEVIDVDLLNAIAAYGGFPTRFPHWRFGMEYQRLAKGYSSVSFRRSCWSFSRARTSGGLI